MKWNKLKGIEEKDKKDQPKEGEKKGKEENYKKRK